MRAGGELREAGWDTAMDAVVRRSREVIEQHTRPGVIFAPFHYGYFDSPSGHQPGSGPGTAANELTRTEWDPVSKQPASKLTAVKVTKVTASSPEEASP